MVLIIISFSNIEAHGEDETSFTGQNGSPSGSTLYEATNTFSYVENTNHNRIHSYFNTSSPLSNASPIKSGAPQITVITHGLGGNASHWSNDGNNNFAYDRSSIISRIDEELSKKGNDANIYWAVMQSSTSFCLYDLKNTSNKNNLGVYQPNAATTSITNVSKHIIIIFEATKYEGVSATNGYNYEVYEEFNYMLSKIVYDVKVLNNGYLPKINLIGHSRGGLTNLEYALDHPLMIDSVFSLGTPYFGSDTASTTLGAYFTNNSNGRNDIICDEVYLNYYNRWLANKNSLYNNIGFYALGGFSDTDFLFDALIEDENITNQYISGDILSTIRDMAFHSPGIIFALKTVSNKRRLLMDALGNYGISEELDNYIELLVDLRRSANDDNSGFWQNLWSDITHTIPFVGCPYFMNDLLVDLSSQIGEYEHSDSNEKYNFNTYQKCFRNEDYENKSKKLSDNDWPAIVHNLEARDDDLINFILSKIPLGYNDTFLYDVISNNTAKIIGYKGSILFSSIEIPSQMDGYTITEISSNVFHNDGSSITSITIPTSIGTIAQEAFFGLPNLQEVIISSNGNLTYIGDRAFAGCPNLSKFGDSQGSLNLPNYVIHVGEQAFCGDDFQFIRIGAYLNTIGSGAFSNIDSLYFIIGNVYNYYYLSNSDGVLFSNDGQLIQYPIAKNSSSYTIPSYVQGVDITEVLDGAFMNATSLTSLSFGQIQTIGESAFSGCSSLLSITLPSTLTFIEPSAFKDCTDLNTVSFSNNLTTIGHSAFKGCESLEEIDIPSSVLSIDGDVFRYCDSLETVSISKYQLPLTSLGIGAFDNCSNSLEISVPKDRIAEYKNKIGWLRYNDIIVPDSTNYPSYNLNSSSNFIISNNVNAGCNKMYELIVNYQSGYTIKVTSSGSVSMKLYDDDFEVVEISSNPISELLYSGHTYYLSVEFSNANSYGNITVNIQKNNNHYHNYLYTWVNYTKHRKICSCGSNVLEGHAVESGSFGPGQQYATCIMCGGLASVGFIEPSLRVGYPTTLNGSYIIPNGVVVLVEDDIESYLDGTLVFIYPNVNSPSFNNPPYILKKEEDYYI